jgi:hypothetical protein
MTGKTITLTTALLIAVLAAICFVALKAQPKSSTPVYFNFVGFQNSTNGWEAVFYVTNWPRASTSWHPEQVSHRNGLHWQRVTNFTPRLGLSIQNQTNITVTFAVPGTNVPLRTVAKLETEEEGWLARLRKMIPGMPRPPYRPGNTTVRWITNEITTVQMRAP